MPVYGTIMIKQLMKHTIIIMIDTGDTNYSINGSNSVLTCRNGLQGINSTGFKISDLTNFTINLTSHGGRQSSLKTILMQLDYHHVTIDSIMITQHKCVYAMISSLVLIYSTPFIRRGYWFGTVSDKSTLTMCPNKYCNFICCVKPLMDFMNSHQLE